jgi:sterol desaturase/sphingolipid hydroxylase (fatty acid hydroxylase superfamily)
VDWAMSGAAIASLAGIGLLLIGLLLAETFSPLRPAISPTTTRWIINVALYLISVLIAAVLVPGQWTLGLGTIAWVGRTVGEVPAVVFGVLVLDFSFYALHRLEHAFAFLWRLHLVHHSDLDVDVTTAIRHHPGETLLDCVTLGGVTVLLGIPADTIALYGVLTLGAQMLQHANVGVPARLERLAGVILVTPRLHRRHHSDERAVSDTNFGLVFSIWDRLFGTLDSSSRVSQFGVEGINWQCSRSLWKTLALPVASREQLRRELTDYQSGATVETPRSGSL